MLNPTQVKNLKPKPGNKITKIRDIENLYLIIKANGNKSWWFRYYIDGKEKGLSLGVYPSVSLKEAREEAQRLKDLHDRGVDPSDNRKAQQAAQEQRQANSFEVVAREWFAVKMSGCVGAHRDKVIASLENDVFPYIGARPIADITTPEMLDLLRRIESRGVVETAHRVKGRCSAIFCYAVATNRASADPTVALRDALRPVVRTHMAAATTPEAVVGILRMIYGYHGSPVVTAALKLAPLVFVRPGELRMAEWKDINLVTAEWRYSVSKTRSGGVAEHIVPLSRQAVEILAELRPLTGGGRYVFPSPTSADRPMSNNAVLAAFRRMGVGTDEMTGHGWRATARTLIEEVLGYQPHIIEQQLAHVVRDPLGRAYNRTTHLDTRRTMMQAWADYLDTLRR